MAKAKKEYVARPLTKVEEQICAAQARMYLMDSKISEGSQDYTVTQLYKAVFEYTSGAIKQTIRQKLRITIKSDAYAAQCFARISVYSSAENKWNPLASIEPGNMVTEHGLSSKPKAPSEYEFQRDIDELQRLANLILE